jgi:hypothetical protein
MDVKMHAIKSEVPGEVDMRLLGKAAHKSYKIM